MVESGSNDVEKETNGHEQGDEKIDQTSGKRKRDESPEVKNGEHTKKFCTADGPNDESNERSNICSSNEKADEIQALATEQNKDAFDLNSEKTPETDVNGSAKVTEKLNPGEEKEKDVPDVNIEEKGNDNVSSTDGADKLPPSLDEEKNKDIADANDLEKSTDDVAIDKATTDETNRRSPSLDEKKEKDIPDVNVQEKSNDDVASTNVTSDETGKLPPSLDEQKERDIPDADIGEKSNDDAATKNVTTDKTSTLAASCDTDAPSETGKDSERKEDTEEQNDNAESKTTGADQAKENSNDMDIAKESDETESPNKKKTRKVDSEIINGVELTVECASEQESSDEEEHVDSGPRKKTLIVREAPNDSEFDDHCSEDEKSDTYHTLEARSKSGTQNNGTTKVNKKTPAGKNTRSRVVQEKSKDESKSQSDKDGSSVSDEDTKLSRRSRVKATKNSRSNKRKSSLRARSWEEDEDVDDAPETSDEEWTANKRNRRKTRARKNSRAGNDVKRHVHNKTKVRNLSREEKSADSDDLQIEYSNISPDGNKNLETQSSGRIEQFKKFIRAAGLRVKCFDTMLADCRTEKAKVERLSQFLSEKGIKGRPTLQKCIKFKEENETANEVMELDSGNIISDTRVTRGRRSQRSQQEDKGSSTRELRTSARKISIVDDDSN